MSATIAKARVSLYFTDTFSLKDKRAEVKRIAQRIRNKFNCAISEIEDLNDLRVATFGVVVLSNDPDHAHRMLQTVIDAIDDLVDASQVGDIETELIPFD